MPNVELKAVRKSYGVPVLHGVSDDISEGKFAILAGPSGCGESTLLLMIAGLEDASGGVIQIVRRPVIDFSLRPEFRSANTCWEL